MKDFYDLPALRAITGGIIEYGTVELLLDKEIVCFTIHEYSNGDIFILLDDNYQHIRKKLEEYGIKFVGETDKIDSEEFESFIHNIYQQTAQESGHVWEDSSYNIDDYNYVEEIN